MKDNGDRESFEAEYAKYQGLTDKAYNLWFERHRDGYTSSSVHASWWGFQAGAAWQRAQSAPASEVEAAAWMRDGVDGKEYCEKPFTTDWTPLYTRTTTQPAAQELCNCPGGSKLEPYKHAPNCPYRLGAAARQEQGDEVRRLREAVAEFFEAKQAKDDFERENPGDSTKRWDSCLSRVEATEEAMRAALSDQGEGERT